MLVQEVVRQVFCFIQPFLWEATGTADYVMPTLGLLDENLLEMILKVLKDPAYQAETDSSSKGEEAAALQG